MRREPWDKNPRRWEGMPYIEDFALRRGYDLLIHGKGGPIPKTDFRYEQIPWLRPEHFLQRSTTYPLDLHLLINKKTWDPIWEYGTRRASASNGCGGYGYFMDLLGRVLRRHALRVFLDAA